MPKLVSNSPDVAPRLIGNQLFRLSSQPRPAASLMTCSLRSTAATTIGFDRNASKFIPDVNWSIVAIAYQDVPEPALWRPDSKTNQLALLLFKHLSAAASSCRRKLALTPRILSEAGSPDRPSQIGVCFLVRSKSADNVDIGRFTNCCSTRVGTVQPQMFNTGRLQFRFIFPQSGDDCGLVHSAALLYILSHPVLKDEPARRPATPEPSPRHAL